MRRFGGWGVMLACVLALPAAREAGAGVPTDQLKGGIDRVVKTIEDPALQGESRAAERRRAVRKVANDIFDWGEIARRSLARHWQPLTEPQRAEFVALFADLLERSYISKIELYGGERIQFTGESLESEIAVVRSRLVTKQGTEIPIDYRMLRKGEKWLVYDVVIEGVRLIANYRTQFNKIITTSSYQELVKKMKEKQQEAPEAVAKRKVVPVSTVGGEEATPAAGRRQSP